MAAARKEWGPGLRRALADARPITSTVFVATGLGPSKNTTELTRLSTSVVAADMVRLIGPTNEAPLAGAVKVIIGVHDETQLELLKAVQAGRVGGLEFGARQRRQQHGREDRYDGDHHQQFDEGKTRAAACRQGHSIII